MCLRQAFERKEISEVRWIDGESNPADAMTKSKPCSALKRLIDLNQVSIDARNWVDRVVEGKGSDGREGKKESE